MIEIKLTKGFTAIIDDDDYEKIKHPKWHYQKKRNTGYAIRSKKIDNKITTERLHRLIVNAKKGDVVDHINGNGLDNRKENLRIVSHKINCINRRSKSKTTGYKGVSYNKLYKKFSARIGPRNNHFLIGYFESAKEAAIAYDNKAKEVKSEIILYARRLPYQKVRKPQCI